MINKKIEETIQETVKKESIASETLNSTFENAQKQINKIVLKQICIIGIELIIVIAMLMIG